MKNKIKAISALLLTFCMSLGIAAMVGCDSNNDNTSDSGSSSVTDTSDGDTSTTTSTADYTSIDVSVNQFVTIIVGKDLSTSNLNVYLTKGTTQVTQIQGMGVEDDVADTVMFVVNGTETDTVQITSASQTVTVRYTGEKYSVGTKDVDITVTAVYADSVAIVPGVLASDFGNISLTSKATVGDGADDISVVVTYSSTSTDTKASFTITINGAADGTLVEGKNTIAITSVCLTADGAEMTATLTYTLTSDGNGGYTDDYDWSAYETAE